jgi:hypothetical protein
LSRTLVKPGEPRMAQWHLPLDVAAWIAALANPLDLRLQGRLLVLFTGMLFAREADTQQLLQAG